MVPRQLQTPEYREWLKEVKAKVRSAQIKASVHVNTELLALYWDLGKMISEKQSQSNWGDRVIEQLSKDLMAEFPEMEGFSRRNLFYIKRWYLFYNQSMEKVPQLFSQLKGAGKVQQLVAPMSPLTKVQQPVAQHDGKSFANQIILQIISRIPWGHHIQILTHCKRVEEALFYVVETLNNNWSRNVLVHQIESKLYRRKGKAITNFDRVLPEPLSDLARETLKNPYSFDFLTLSKDAQERDLEQALIEHLKDFLIEIGVGFAFVGEQFHLEVGDQDFYIDLLFYHTRLHSYFVVELKIGEFIPEYAGKINFYLSAVDSQLKSPEDNPTIGLLLCRKANKVIAEYALRDMKKPIGVSEYRLTEVIPRDLKGKLPTVKQLEDELEGRFLKATPIQVHKKKKNGNG